MSRSKGECLSKILLDNEVDVLALQETHIENLENCNRGDVPGYKLVGGIGHRVYGIATYVRQDIDDVSLIHVSCDGDVFILAVRVAETTIINIYKPPNISWPDSVLPKFEHPAVYVGDFNSHHSQWGYTSNDDNGTRLSDWAENNNFVLVFNAKDPKTFQSARWKRGYNPDLCFCSSDQSSIPLPAQRRVLDVFPHSQHRPVLVSTGIQIPLIRSFPRPRWNFNKADWGTFSLRMEEGIRFITPCAESYDRFAGLVLSTAKKCIPRGFRREYIPGWSKECEDLYEEFISNGDSDTADRILHSLDLARQEKWAEAVSNMDFSRGSRKAWSLLRKLSTGKASIEKAASHPDPNCINKRLVGLSKPVRHHRDKKVTYKYNEIKKSQQAPLEISKDFTLKELDVAIAAMPSGKAAGFDNIYPEFLKHAGDKVKQWLLKFFNSILVTGGLPASFKRAKIVAVVKPGKDPKRVESYRPIALLSVCYKLLERLVYNRILPILDASIPVEQAGFRPGRNCCDQVLSLTSFIENGFEKNQKSSVAFIDLTSAYDTVWRKGLLIKVYDRIPCPYLFRLLDSMLTDRLLKVQLGRKESSFRHVNDGLPQGSVLAPLLFNVYTADMPATVSRKFIYADDIALAVQHNNLQATEVALTNDLSILKDYFKTWKLNPNPTKTEVACFHLNNSLSRYKLNVTFDGVRLNHTDYPKYLGVTLDRSLTFKNHIEKTAGKVSTRVNLMQNLARTSWGADALALRTTALSLVYSTAEYCAPVWLNSAHVHKIDVQLNRAMRSISGTLMATPLHWLPVLSNIAPPDIRRKEALLREFRKISSAPHLPIFHDLPHHGNRLKSRKPPLKLATQLQDSGFTSVNAWASSWERFVNPNKFLVHDPTTGVAGMTLPRKEWTTLNRFRTGVGRSNSWKARWGQVVDPACDCGADVQSMEHILSTCPLRAFPGGLAGLHQADEAATNWLRGLDLAV